jgi:hypothetical protein
VTRQPANITLKASINKISILFMTSLLENIRMIFFPFYATKVSAPVGLEGVHHKITNERKNSRV